MNDCWIQTYTGKKFYPFEPSPDMVCIEDISHSLSMKCRFAGHCIKYYSVAQHSVIGSRYITRDLALWFLLHDAAEGYMFDCPRPIKQMMPEIKNLELKIMEVVAKKFLLQWPEPLQVKIADSRMLQTERQQLMGDGGALLWSCLDRVVPYPVDIIPTLPRESERAFLSRFQEVVK